MRILLIVPGGVDEGGKVRVIPSLLAFIERLAQRHETTVVALRQYRDPRSYRLLQARVINLGYRDPNRPGLNLPLQWRRLRRFLDDHSDQFDLIHAFWLDYPGALAVLAGRRIHRPIVASLGGGEMVRIPEIRYGGSMYRFKQYLIRWVLRSSDAVTAGSQYALKSLREKRPDAFWVPLFPDTGPFIEGPRTESGPPWRLLQVASVNRVKDPFSMLRALRVVIDRYPETILDWVGEDILDGEIQRRAERMGLETNIVFHGLQEYINLPRFYRQAHVYVQSSLHESQGVAVCEAAAAGVPIVGTDVGLVKELSPDKALAVPAGNPQALARGIFELLDDSEKRVKLARQAKNWARRHQADWSAKRFESIYEEVLAHPGEETGDDESV
jgi:glycosyltransferase involved in cell wall biosynthesis